MRSTERSAVQYTQPGLTQQHFRKEANINSIMRKYTKTGILVDAGKPMRGAPQFGVFDQFDFLESQNKVVQAKQAFMALPARIRQRFANNPAQLLEFIGDEKNRAEAIAIGLIQEQKAEKKEEKAPEPPSA